MRDQVDILLKLRLLDDQLQAARARMSARQADLQRRRMEAELVRQALAQERERLKDAQSRRREADMEVRTFRERKVHFETQLNSRDVRTNAQYQALLREIDTMERKAREWEDVVLGAMEEEEGAQGKVSRMEEDSRAKEAVAEGERAQVEREAAEVERVVEGLNAERGVLVEKLTGMVRAKYERLRGAKGESVIVAVRSGSCGGCHYRLPPQTVNEVRLGERLLLCEACGRILVWVPEAASAV